MGIDALQARHSRRRKGIYFSLRPIHTSQKRRSVEKEKRRIANIQEKNSIKRRAVYFSRAFLPETSFRKDERRRGDRNNFLKPLVGCATLKFFLLIIVGIGIVFSVKAALATLAILVHF